MAESIMIAPFFKINDLLLKMKALSPNRLNPKRFKLDDLVFR